MSVSGRFKVVALGILLLMLMSPSIRGDIVVFDNEAADNDWNNPVNWFNFSSSTNNVLPGPGDQALLNGDNLAVIASNSAFSPSQFWMSNALGGTLNVQADLTASSGIILGLTGQNVSPAVVNQSAGNVVGAGFVAISGAGGNVPLSPSVYEISGGSLVSPFYSIGTVGFGTLSIIGSSPSVSSSGTVVFGAGGTLEFVLGSAGVSPLVAQFTNNHASGSSLSVDGSAYTGGAAVIPLVQVNATDNPFANISVTGFSSGLQAVVSQNGGDVNLTITSLVPEPTGWTMAVITLMLGMVGNCNRMRRARTGGTQ